MKTHEEICQMCDLVITAGAMKMISCEDNNLAHRILDRLNSHSSCTESALWCDLAARALEAITSDILEANDSSGIESVFPTKQRCKYCNDLIPVNSEDQEFCTIQCRERHLRS